MTSAAIDGMDACAGRNQGLSYSERAIGDEVCCENYEELRSVVVSRLGCPKKRRVTSAVLDSALSL
jgi:hypothetical protein